MGTVRRTRAELAATGFRFDAVERARLDAMSDEEIERLAREDPDNPPLTDQELSRMVAARSVRCSSARMRSQSITLERRCARMSTVRSAMSRSSAS